LFALMMVARPVTNRELRERSGLEITAKVLRLTNKPVQLIVTNKLGAVNRHELTPAGRSWCEANLTAGRPDGARFPAGALYGLLDSVGQYLARSGVKSSEFFRPDIEGWIRAAYAELTVRRGPRSWVKLSALRPWLGDTPRAAVDAALDRMIEQPDVHLMAELNRRILTDDARSAAVEIGGEPRHLLMIGPA
jgi:hypothetical protein